MLAVLQRREGLFSGTGTAVGRHKRMDSEKETLEMDICARRLAALCASAMLLFHGCTACPDSVPGVSEVRIAVHRQADVRAMLILNDGSRVVVGSRFTDANPEPHYVRDAYVVKADAAGQIQWIKTWDSGDYDEWADIQTSGDGGYYLAGRSGSAFEPDSGLSVAVIAKIDGNGNEVWSRVLTSSADADATSLSVNTDGSFVVTGSEGTGAFLLKLDANGTEAWRRQFEQTFARSVVATSDGGYVIAGQGSDYALYVLKTDADGIMQWQFDEAEAIGFSFIYSSGADVVETRDGGFAVACTVIDEEFEKQLFVTKLDFGGSVLWGSIAPDAPYASAFGICEVSDGSLVAGGNAYAFHQLFDSVRTCYSFYGARLSENGQVLWSARLGEVGTVAQSMAIDQDGKIVFSGRSQVGGDDLIHTLTTAAGG